MTSRPWGRRRGTQRSAGGTRTEAPRAGLPTRVPTDHRLGRFSTSSSVPFSVESPPSPRERLSRHQSSRRDFPGCTPPASGLRPPPPPGPPPTPLPPAPGSRLPVWPARLFHPGSCSPCGPGPCRALRLGGAGGRGLGAWLGPPGWPPGELLGGGGGERRASYFYFILFFASNKGPLLTPRSRDLAS